MKLKKTISIREQLGLTQDDMAAFLKVSRVQLSLYEIDKRDLPSAVKLKLAQIEQFLNLPNTEKETDLPHFEQQQNKVNEILEQQALVNQHKQLIAQKKLESIKKKYDQSLTLLKVLNHFETNAKKSTNDSAFLQAIQNQALMTLEKNGLHEQIKHQIKLQGIMSLGKQIVAHTVNVKADIKKA